MATHNSSSKGGSPSTRKEPGGLPRPQQNLASMMVQKRPGPFRLSPQRAEESLDWGLGKVTANREIREDDRRVEASGSEATSRPSQSYYSAKDSLTALDREDFQEHPQHRSAGAHGQG